MNGRFSAISIKGDNFCVFLFASVHIRPLLKKESTHKGKCLREQILSF